MRRLPTLEDHDANGIEYFADAVADDFTGAAGEGMAVLKAAYTAYNEDKEDKKSFEALMRAPLLLSKEQDELVAGLRNAGFEERFAYNAQTGDWEVMDA